MAAPFPYTHYACSCSDLINNAVSSEPSETTSNASSIATTTATTQIDEERTFNPHDPRANYALYPLDQLLFCDECDVVRCPRCWAEEISTWYCPSCLFDMGSLNIRSDGNRCQRSCYECPSCTSPLAIVALPTPDDGLLKPGGDAAREGENYILRCPYCEWSTLEIDVQFNKPTKITEQLNKIRKLRVSPADEESESEPQEEPNKSGRLDHDTAFANLRAFYQTQLGETADLSNPSSNSAFNSPANLTRLMNLYSDLSFGALKKTREKPQPMREAMTASEGLQIYTTEDGQEDAEMIGRMSKVGWDGLSSREQRYSSPVNHSARFTADLWPSATRLRTRRDKRCGTCRHLLTRKEPKTQRYLVRLTAINFLPRFSLKPLHTSTSSTTSTAVPGNPSFRLRNEGPDADIPPLLRPGQTQQYILTVRNPIFERVSVTLATPTTTPGRIASRVTILCPSFTVGADGDALDEILSTSSSSLSLPTSSDGSRRAAMASLTSAGTAGEGGTSGEKLPEAGKIWERTRNSTSVVLEVVPGSLPGGSVDGVRALGEDEDVLEVPVYVRVEWEVRVKDGGSEDSRNGVERKPGEKVKKERGYWVVLGIGRIGGG